MIEQKTITTPMGTKKKYFYDPQKPAEYRRIVGGIAWPAEKDGFIIVTGEDYHEDPTLKLRHYRLMDEFEGDNISRLIKKLYDYQNIYKVQNWYGDPDNEMMMKFISKFNQGLGPRKRGVYISEALFVNDAHNFKYYAPQIKKLISKSAKSLHFGQSSQLPGRLSGLTSIDVDKAKISDYPSIAALGYSIAGLSETYYDYIAARELQDQMIQTYNVEGL